jgi:hypothetical protein
MEASMPARYEPIWVFISAFGISSFGGIAARLRSKEPVDLKSLVGAFLFSGFIGLLICLALYNYYDGKDNIPLLLAISGLAGIGGANVLDLLMLFLGGKLKFTIIATPTPDVSAEPDKEDKEEKK